GLATLAQRLHRHACDDRVVADEVADEIPAREARPAQKGDTAAKGCVREQIARVRRRLVEGTQLGGDRVELRRRARSCRGGSSRRRKRPRAGPAARVAPPRGREERAETEHRGAKEGDGVHRPSMPESAGSPDRQKAQGRQSAPWRTGSPSLECQKGE